MSKFNKYAKEFNTVAKGYLEEFSNATSGFADAEIAYNKHKRPNGVWNNPTVEQVALAASTEVDFHTAKDRLAKAKGSKLEETKKAISEIRNRLKDEAEAYYTAKPSEVDSNLVAILDADMLTPAEYVRLYDRMVKEENITMARLIGAAAGKVAEKMQGIEHPSVDQRNDRTMLSMLSQKARTFGTFDHLKAFDELTELFNICARNASMYNRWDEFVGKHVENF